MNDQTNVNIPQLKSDIASGKLGLAMETMLQDQSIKGSQYFDDLILLKSRLSRKQRNEMLGIISGQEANMEHNQLTHAMMELLKEISKQLAHALEWDQQDAPMMENPVSIRILMLAANPENSARLFLDKEFRDIVEQLQRAKYSDKFSITIKLAARIGDLTDSLLNDPPNIVHFSGHGSKEGILFHDDKDTAQYIGDEALARLFMQFRKSVACVVLNACYSEIQGMLINQHIRYVIGMKQPIQDQAAIEFSTAFYKALGAGREIDFAFEFAKNSLDLRKLPSEDVPVLLYNPKI